MTRGALVFALVIASAGAAGAQPPDPGRVMRTMRAEGSAFPPRWPRRPLLDAATEAAGIVTARDALGRDGFGASVCVVDTGVDLAHRDFRDETDATRVSWLFDFESPPRGVHTTLEERFGCAVWRGDELDASDRAPGDENGHGTAVAAVALGDDAGPGETFGVFAGAAPRASLIVVKLPLEEGIGFSDTGIALGTEACFSVDDPERTVAVLSFGGHDGRHDGTEPLDVALDELVASGGRIVAAAGNDGAEPIHATGSLGSRATVTLPLSVPRPEPPDEARFVSVGITAISSARLTVTAPDGTRVGPIALGERAEAVGSAARIVIDGTVSADPRRGTLYVVVSNGEEGTFGGDYALEIETSGRFDAWIVDRDLGNTILGPRFRGPFVEAGGTITVPGTASEVITVGASITHTRLETDRGEIRIDGTPGEVASFSSVGPPPGGRAKPDLVAPGAMVVTALSSDAVDGDPANLFRGAPDRIARQRVAPDRIALSGTSFTAPLVAGVIALQIAEAPGDDVLNRLRYSARPEAAPWNDRAGFGHLDAERFFTPVPAAPGAELVATAPVDLASPHLFVSGRVTTVSGPHTGDVELLLGGEPLDTVSARAGIVRDFSSLPPLFPGESITLEARVAGEIMGTLTVRGRIDAARERSVPAVRGGHAACSAGGRPSGAAIVFVAMLLLVTRGTRLR